MNQDSAPTTTRFGRMADRMDRSFDEHATVLIRVVIEREDERVWTACATDMGFQCQQMDSDATTVTCYYRTCHGDFGSGLNGFARAFGAVAYLLPRTERGQQIHDGSRDRRSWDARPGSADPTAWFTQPRTP